MAIKIDLECPLKYSAEFYIQILYKAFKFDINAENVEFATFVKSLDDFTLVNKIIGMHEKRIYDCNWVRYTSSREGRSIELKMRYEDTSNHANDIVLFSGEFHLKNNHLVLKKINEFNEAFYKYSEAFDQSKKEMVPNDIELSFKEKPKIKNPGIDKNIFSSLSLKLEIIISIPIIKNIIATNILTFIIK